MTHTSFAAESSTAISQSEALDATAGGTEEGLVFARRDFVADWLQDRLIALDQLRKLEENWDSYGARSVDLTSIAIAAAIIKLLAEVIGICRPNIAASPAGNVGLSWEWEDCSRELDVEILPDISFRYSYLDEENPDLDREGTTRDLNIIANLLTAW
ncbi:hypothetical protein Mal52_61420 [Symmachiella dynata]|uniref:Uncharacterized protein n=1 Tax=Symmachiella dynata TaxID=2527995 RepID=A0A517ZYP2_9PLAN|nr:hypothetical protein [Symmachiella dynata]QDU47607.1 hypothetical protein Mal52_61420 [Symmachiella dynata]